MKNRLLWIILLVGFNICHLSAQMSIRVPEVGELRAQLTEEEAQQVTHLTLTGKLNAIDFKVLRDEFNKLEYLDLTNAEIKLYVGKKGTYPEKTYVYPMNCIPAYAFKDKKTLKQVILSPNLKNIEEVIRKKTKIEKIKIVRSVLQGVKACEPDMIKSDATYNTVLGLMFAGEDNCCKPEEVKPVNSLLEDAEEEGGAAVTLDEAERKLREEDRKQREEEKRLRKEQLEEEKRRKKEEKKNKKSWFDKVKESGTNALGTLFDDEDK